MAWFRDQPKCLLAGMNQKVLRVFDIRIEGGSGGWNSKPTLNTFTRAVYGVCVDPYLDHRVASIQDNQVKKIDS